MPEISKPWHTRNCESCLRFEDDEETGAHGCTTTGRHANVLTGADCPERVTQHDLDQAAIREKRERLEALGQGRLL